MPWPTYPYIKVKGEWKYLYRALDEHGNTIDFYLSKRRNAKAAKLFLKKLINNNQICDVKIINTDKNHAYTQAIKELKQEGKLNHNIKHLRVKYRNNQLEADHGKLKQLINPVRGFQSMKTACSILNRLNGIFFKKYSHFFMFYKILRLKFAD